MGIFWKRKEKTFPHGIHPKDHKDTGDKEVRRIPFAPLIILPLSTGFGKSSIPCVKVGEMVLRGQKIAEADGYMSVPLHSSVSGTVKEIVLAMAADGTMVRSIVIVPSSFSPQSDIFCGENVIDEMSREELVRAIQSVGLVGLGGAGFPTHVKANPPKEHSVHTVLVNGCECEPFLTTDHRVMLESLDDMLLGIKIVMKTTGAGKAIIGLEGNTADVLKTIKQKLPDDGTITIVAMPTKYPQGFEKMLVKSLLGIEVPARQVPSSVGVSVFNVATLAEMGRLIPVDGGLIERVITVAGPGVKKPGNYLIPFGTPLKFVLEQCGYEETDDYVVIGGPMMGKTVAFLEAPVTKTTSGILVFDKTMADLRKDLPEYPCIKCGACLEACPMFLDPSTLGLLAKKKSYEVMRDDYNLDLCCSCNCCTYVCPSNIPLLSLFKTAQEINRKKK